MRCWRFFCVAIMFVLLLLLPGQASAQTPAQAYAGLGASGQSGSSGMSAGGTLAIAKTNNGLISFDRLFYVVLKSIGYNVENENALPENVQILNAAPSIWDSDSMLLSTVIVLLMVIVLLIAGTCVFIITNNKHNRQKNKLQREQAMEEAAQAASRAKSDFLSHMSHEIRTPLNAIIGMISIGMSTGDIDKKNYCLNRADSASKNLLRIINDILDMSKIEAGSFELSKCGFDFEKMLLNIRNVVSVKAEEKLQSFDVNLSRDVPLFIEGDELRLSRVITNLLTNAIKFTQEKGMIRLNVEKIGEEHDEVCLQFEVSDTGIGISKEQQERIFTSFSQADASITKEFGGTGLGLAISKRIVELMGGDIWVESELGYGAKFVFTLKARRLLDKPYEAEYAERNIIPKRSYDFFKHTILIAEDVEINREIVGAILDETGITIDFAENGAEAYSAFAKQPDKYSLILMDVNMPEMDGHEATRQIRALEFKWAKEVPILAMTANVFREDINKCIENGMNDHTGKPIDSEELFSMLNKYLNAGEAKSARKKSMYEFDHGIAWDDGLISGNTLVDMQHQQIFELVSDLVRSCEEGSNVETLHDTLAYLVDYTVQHFTDEEALQLEFDYPDYWNHRQIHEEFKTTVTELMRRFEASGSSDELSRDVNKVIIRWLVYHIRHEDRKLSDYIRSVVSPVSFSGRIIEPLFTET